MSMNSFVVDIVEADFFHFLISQIHKLCRCEFKFKVSHLLALCSERVCKDVCVFFVFGVSMSFLVGFLHRSPVPEHIVQSRTSVFGPNNSGSFLVYRIISCLGSNTVSHHSVRYERLEIHQVIKDRVKVEGSVKDNLIL